MRFGRTVEKARKRHLDTVMIQFSTDGANLLLVAQGRPFIGEGAYRGQGAHFFFFPGINIGI